MAQYVSNNINAGTPQATSSAFKTQLSLTAATATLTRGLIREIHMSVDGNTTPADNSIIWDISPQTTLGTGTNSAPSPTDGTIRAAGSVGTLNMTVEPTVTAAKSVFNHGISQRTVYRWTANPDGELIIPAINVNGWVVRAKSTAYTGLLSASAWHSE